VYAIPARDPNEAGNNPVVFESLAQTDATGHYRLEVPSGRYYIAAGSVESPTYFPDTTVLSSARPILITAGTVTEGVNFSKYIAASASGLFGRNGITLPVIIPVPQPNGSTGILSGLVRYTDGSPASGIAVIAVPLSTLNPGSTMFLTSPSDALTQSNNLTAAAVSAMSTSLLSMMRLVRGTTRTYTDSAGHYRLDNVSPDSYYIVTGNSDSPIFYPGTRDIAMADAIATTPSTMMDAVNFTIAPPVMGISIRGRTLGMTGEPAVRATLDTHSLAPSPEGVASLLPEKTYKTITAGSDGSFEIPGVVPGSYFIMARLPGSLPVSKNIRVADQPVDLDFTFPVSVLSARILWEDGSPVSFPVITEVAVSNTSNPNLFATTIFPAVLGGVFNMVLESGQYRFFVRDLPEGYSIRSVQSGTADLIKDPLDIGHIRPSDIEVRIAKTPAASNSNATDNVQKVRGTVLDAASGLPPQASRLQLCCFATGPVERLSTAIGADGSFEFSNVPAGQYTAELRVSPPARIVDPEVVVGNPGSAGQTLVSSAQFVSINLSMSTESGRLPPGSVLSVTLSSVPGPSTPGFRVTKSGPIDEMLYAFVPAGVRYTVTVSNLPAAFKVKSIVSGTTDLMSGPLNLVATPPSPTNVKITLTPRE
jgi:hypothetical protein